MIKNLVCPLSMITASGNSMLCPGESCMFWDQENNCCVMRTFFVNVANDYIFDGYQFSKSDNQDVV